MRWNKVVAVVVAAAIVGGAGYVGAAWAGGSNPEVASSSGRAFGGTAPLDTSFAVIEPCRLMDTRVAGGALAPGEARKIDVRGAGATFAAQGGKAGGCGIPATGVTSVQVTVTAVSATGTGFLRVFPSAEPKATFMNYDDDYNTSGSGPVKICTTCSANQDLTIRNAGSSTQLVVDVTGYFSSAMTIYVMENGAVISSISNRYGTVTHPSTGIYTVTFDRDISSCAALPAIGHLSGKSGDVAVAQMGGNKVEVAIEDNDGNLVDQAFQLHIIC